MINLLKKQNNYFSVETPFQSIQMGIAARQINTIDYNKPHSEVRADEKKLLHNITSIEEKNILFLNQVHEDTVLLIDTPPFQNKENQGDADAIITDIPGICLVIRTADCVPVFAFDPVNRVLGAAHSGWRGTQLNIAGTLIEKMIDVYKCRPSNIHAYILPSIGPESYEVNTDVSQHFPRDHKIIDGKIYLDLWQNIIRILKEKGLSPRLINNAGICNLTHNHDFFSHRKGDPERNLNFAFMKK